VLAAAVALACAVGSAWAQTPAFEVTDTDIRVGGPPIEPGSNTGHLPLEPGVPVVLMAAYRNTSATTATETVWLEVEGVRVDEIVLSLTAGTRKEVEFTRTFDRPGVYRARICTQDTCEEFMIGVASPGFLHTLSESEWNVNAIAFSPDGKILASAAELWGNVAAINLWDVASGKVLHSLTSGDKGYIYACVAFSPDGKTLAAGRGDQNVVLWDVSPGTLLHTIETEAQVDPVAFSPDGRTLAVASQESGIYNFGQAVGRSHVDARAQLLRVRGLDQPVQQVCLVGGILAGREAPCRGVRRWHDNAVECGCGNTPAQAG